MVLPRGVIQVYEAASDYEITRAEAMQLITRMLSDLTSAMMLGFVLWTVGMVGMTASKGFLPEHHTGGNEMKMPEIERYHGIIVAVGGINTKTLSLPDWDLSYVEFPPGQMREYRDALTRARVDIVRVTDRRIYFEQ